ncbi:MAG: glycosyltransferase family 2 protein [Lachnospiraceae bacterium]|nr:glycosyltransferase family 2 protein [Lachnospiraceae bacterium]
MDKITLIIPVFNEQESLKPFYTELNRVTEEMNEQEFEILFVDDGSTDISLEMIKEMASSDRRIRYISFSRNFGKEAAMYAGFVHSTGDYVAVMDADLQDPPSLLPEMYKGIVEEGYDSVATRRVTRKGEPKVRSFFARRFYKLINRISDAKMVDGARDYRLMSRKMVDAILAMSEVNRFSKGIYGWIGFNTKWLAYENVNRVAGKSKWSFRKLVKYSIEGIVDFSTLPLKISSFMGIALCILGALAIIFLVIRKLVFGDPVQGWASLTCIVLFVGGVQLFCIGIMGQYLARTYLETKKRPVYLVRESNIEEKE